MRHLIDPLYFSVQETEALLDVADDICDNMDKYSHKCDGKILYNLFRPPLLQNLVIYGKILL